MNGWPTREEREAAKRTKRARSAGRALVQQRGREYMREIGRRGFEATTERHFDGDEEAHKQWLADRGRWEYFQTYGRWREKPKPTHPGEEVAF